MVGGTQEIYKGESKVDNKQTKLYFIKYMTGHLLCGPIRKQGLFRSFTQSIVD